ncbi:DNA adenine methylase [Polaribacter cellanae]|uniref:DNA adenine methylase n=1 Tax=Polaribacter cellanae TaxID=2818493 RepID=A0A975CTV7_9FLAO|nr:DNA adenine methylase [Polaribacter cellanae]QTE23321.1 DNA adenine methylase [Polaribacter cellanae]
MPKTPITYYGGKLNLLSEILPLIPKHSIYTEAFFGGGAVFFAKEPVESEIINDTNNMVVNFYEVIKTDFDWLKTRIQATPFSRASYTVALSIYRMPHLFNKKQQAWAFYVGTNFGFACQIGSWGYDKYGKQAKKLLNKKMSFNKEIFKRLESTQIECNDACKVIKARDSVDTFHYIDPPYFNSCQSFYSGYSEKHFKQLLTTLEGIEGKFLLSSYPSEILTKYIERNGWYSKQFDKPLSAKKSVAGEKRKRKTEVLTANYSLSEIKQ